MKTIHVEFSDEAFDLPKLNWSQLEEIMPMVSGLSNPNTQLATMLDVVQVMIGETYPAVKVRKLPVDVNGMRQAFAEIMKFSGVELKVAKPGEARARGKSTSKASAAA